MTKLIIKRVSSVPFEFSSGVTIAESSQKRTIIQGVLLSEGISRNRNIYTVEEMRNIAKQAVGIPLYYGVVQKGKRFEHKDFDLKTRIHSGESVGRIIKAEFNEAIKKIHFWAEITNQKIAESVKRGWHVSIGGLARRVQYVLDKAGNIFMKLKDVALNHVQLFEPEYKQGFPDAQVEKVVTGFEECMMFDKPALSKKELAGIIAVLRSEGEI